MFRTLRDLRACGGLSHETGTQESPGVIVLLDNRGAERAVMRWLDRCKWGCGERALGRFVVVTGKGGRGVRGVGGGYVLGERLLGGVAEAAGIGDEGGVVHCVGGAVGVVGWRGTLMAGGEVGG